MALPINNYVRAYISFDPPFTTLPTLTDFTDTLRSLSWSYSRQGGPTGACQPSRATFVVSNRDGRWDPSSGLGGATWAGNVDRWLQVRIQVSADAFFATNQVRFLGFITDVRLLDGKFDGYAEVTCTDILGILAAFNLESVERPAELTGARAAAILTAAGIPSTYVSTFQAGTVVLGAATLTGNALAAAQECARAEGGHLWCRPDGGTIRFTDRHYFYDTASLNGVVLDDTVIRSAEIPKTLGAFVNVRQGAASGLTGKVYKYGSVPSLYPTSEKREINTSAVWDTDSKASAEWLQRHGNFSGSRVDSVEVYVSGTDDTALDALALAQLKWLDTVEIDYTPQHGAGVNQVCWVESETHNVTQSEWTLTLGLSPYATDYKNRTDEFAEFGVTISSGQVPAV